jgi:hypothetical protein
MNAFINNCSKSPSSSFKVTTLPTRSDIHVNISVANKVWFSNRYGLNVLPFANLHNGHKIKNKILKLFRYIFSSGILTLHYDNFNSEYIFDTNYITSNYLNVQLRQQKCEFQKKCCYCDECNEICER